MMGRADCWRKVRPDFPVSCSFPAIPAHRPGWGRIAGAGGQVGNGAVWGCLRALEVLLPRWRVGFGLHPGGMLGSDGYYGRTVSSGLTREWRQLGRQGMAGSGSGTKELISYIRGRLMGCGGHSGLVQPPCRPGEYAPKAFSFSLSRGVRENSPCHSSSCGKLVCGGTPSP